jgi:LacI family transcriptional regulator
MPTIRQVAELAGVSVGTVSHVVTGSVPVRESLRIRVCAAITQLNYHPNHVARSLRTSRTRTLGIIVPDMMIPFFPLVIRGAEKAAGERGYSLIAVNSGDDCRRQQELLSLLRSQQVEGILLVTAAESTTDDEIAGILDAGIPVVCLDRIPGGLRADSVSVENLDAARMGVEHLIGAGNRRIAAVTGPLALKNERRRLEGYQKALEEAGIAAEDGLVWEGNLRIEDVAAICRERLGDTSSRPDAIFSTNGPTALGVLHAFHACGLRTPDDIAFATFDELTVNDLFQPSITTIVQPAYDIGLRAADVLLQRILSESQDAEPITVRLPAILKIRESSQPRRAADGVTH